MATYQSGHCTAPSTAIDTDMSLRYGSITHRIIMAALCNRACRPLYFCPVVSCHFIMIIIMSTVFGKRTVSRTSVDATLRRRMGRIDITQTSNPELLHGSECLRSDRCKCNPTTEVIRLSSCHCNFGDATCRIMRENV